MWKNYLKTAFRNLTRARSSTIINIVGLALGLATFIVINAYVQYQRSFDRQLIRPGQSVYRVESRFYKGDQLTADWATSTNGYAPALKDHFPQIADYTRISWNNSERVVRNGNIRFREEHVCYADSNFFSFFPYAWLKGDKATALQGINSVVLSERMAHKYFGNADPLGQLLEISTISSSYPCRVTGVFADVPENSTMQFSMLISWATSAKWQQTTWYQHESYTFLKLLPGAVPGAVETGFPAMAEGYKNGPAFKDLRWAIQLVPFENIHLNAAKQYEIETKGNRTAVQLLNILSYLILLIACINYVNLTTSKALERAKEVGMRKVSGARPYQLIGQFLTESFLLCSFALIPGLVLAGLAGIWLPAWLGGNGIPQAAILDSGFAGRIGLVFVICVIASGFYPALVLTNMQPIRVLKGRYSFSRSGALLRRGLVCFQFVVSLVLIAGSLGVYRQMKFMTTQDPGVQVAQTLVMKAPVRTAGYKEKIQTLKNSLLALPSVSGFTGSGAVPGREVGEFLANRRVGASLNEDHPYEMLKVDFAFIPFYHLELIAGRAFDPSRPTDSVGLVLNESAVRQLGFASPQDAIGKQVWLEVNHNRSNPVIGVVHDYHQQSLQLAYTPLILFMDPDYDWIPTQYFSVQVNTKDMIRTVGNVRKEWDRLFPESSFDSFFLDEFYDRQYRNDRQFARVVGLFSGLAIFIGVIGLFGLTAYSAARRTKEIGVRKVLGASVSHIMIVLTMDFVRLLLLAALIAIPVSIWAIHQWMQDFAFRASLSWELLLLPVVLLFLVMVLTTIGLTFRAARVNPVNSLKQE